MKPYITHKRATFDFDILETYEAGISLLGTEVKSIRSGHGKFEGAYVVIRGNEAFLVGASIPAFQKANVSKSYDPERTRTLLFTHEEIRELREKSERQGLTLVPIKCYNKNRKIKVEIALARGKKKYDKRHAIRERDVARDIAREVRDR